MVWVGSLSTTKALNMNEIKNTVPEEYHEFINWF
jgi:hypothetical protein